MGRTRIQDIRTDGIPGDFMLPRLFSGIITNDGRMVLQMYILSSLLGLSMPTFSHFCVLLSGDVKGAETKPNIRH